MPPTVASLLERARGRFWAFSDAQMPDGVALQFVNERQRSTLLLVIDSVDSLIGVTQQITVQGTETLVALDDDGVPYYSTTTEDAYPIRFDEDDVPYIDTDQPIIRDPYGEFGDVPGLPLREDILRLISVVARDGNSSRESSVEVLAEEVAVSSAGRTGLRAFISANRLVPVRTSASDLWSQVTTLKLSMVLCPTLTALTDEVTLPTALVDVIVAQIAEFLASASPRCTEADRKRFERQAEKAEAVLRATADELLSQVVQSHVVFRRR